MKSIKLIGKQVLVLFIFSILISITMIIHGIYMDLDFASIKRLTIEGLILTFLVIFPAIIFLEWVFDLNNRKKFDEVNKRLNKLEREGK